MERTYVGPLLDKLGVRPGMRVALIAIDDDAIRPPLAERTSDVAEGWPLPDTDIVLLGPTRPTPSPTLTALRLVIPVARRPR